eukprot:15243383-Ditylum_brightwellii.AAC.1
MMYVQLYVRKLARSSSIVYIWAEREIVSDHAGPCSKKISTHTYVRGAFHLGWRPGIQEEGWSEGGHFKGYPCNSFTAL